MLLKLRPAEQDPTLARVGALDSLRGWAIIMVIAVHVSHWVAPTTPTLRTAVTYGFTGVELFFIVSAFSLLYAHEQRKNSGGSSVAAFYARRIFRILPMLWVAMALFLWRSGLGPRDWAPQGISIFDVFIVGIGANGWHPLQVNAVVPVGWSVGVEFSFYVIFPALALLVRSAPRAFIALVLAFMLANLWRKVGWPLYLANVGDDQQLRALTLTFLNYMSLPAQIPVFMSGFLAYFLHPKLAGRTWISVVLLIGFASLYAAIVQGRWLSNIPMLHYIIMLNCFVLALVCRPWSFFDNAVTRWIGKVSYSAYLLHMFVLAQLQSQPWAAAAYPITGDFNWAIAFAGTLAITVALSSIAYVLVEKPFMRIGARVASSLARPKAEAASRLA